MPARNPRVNVVLEKPLYEAARRLARRDGMSVSSKVRDLVREALEAEEDIVLVAWAERREPTFEPTRALTHQQVWRRTRARASRG
ncbi:MAG: antitoxin, RHH family protein [Armatimonadetes bacterium]|nr:antitoxin, RHH family protein [Armatimonadota bacterium]